MIKAASGWLLVGVLPFPAHAAPLAYGFDDGTLQGWTTVSSDPGNSPDPESYVSANLHTVQGGVRKPSIVTTLTTAITRTLAPQAGQPGNAIS